MEARSSAADLHSSKLRSQPGVHNRRRPGQYQSNRGYPLFIIALHSPPVHHANHYLSSSAFLRSIRIAFTAGNTQANNEAISSTRIVKPIVIGSYADTPYRSEATPHHRHALEPIAPRLPFLNSVNSCNSLNSRFSSQTENNIYHFGRARP